MKRLISLSVVLTLGMSSGLFAAGAATVPAPAPAAPAASTPAIEPVIARVQKFYEGVNTLKASFVQTSTLSTLSKKEVQQGVLYLSKPGKMRWEFQQPSERLFVSDGKTLFIYSKADNQVIVQEMKEQAAVAVNFLLGMGDLNKDFTVVAAPEAEYMRPGRTALSLVPKQQGSAVSRLVLSVDSQSGMLQEAWTLDPMGNKTQLTFSNVQVNPTVDAALFTFAPPAGAEVIKGGF